MHRRRKSCAGAVHREIKPLLEGRAMTRVYFEACQRWASPFCIDIPLGPMENNHEVLGSVNDTPFSQIVGGQDTWWININYV